ncbi:MAG: hypothetical protein FWC36_06335 [Spirochaetes bacterium]|nr:hypothetical protein [Spirochaetota bacterium]
MQLIREDDSLQLLVPSFIFNLDSADFEGLDAQTLASNALAFSRIAEVLNEFHGYRISGFILLVELPTTR